jgi:hypothetical protein
MLPRKLRLALMVVLVSVTFVLAYVLLANNAPEYDSSENVINIVFKYGVGAKNELNTFEGTYTKDLIADGTKTTRLILSSEELRQIQQKMVDIGFFSYPESFPPNPGYRRYPREDYYIKVQNGSTVKEVSWNTDSLIDSSVQDNLGQLVTYLGNIIVQKPEYKMLPPAKGAYL